MAARKSAKRSSAKKRAGKRASGKKRSAAKSVSKRRSKSVAKKAGAAKKQIQRAARGPLKTVRTAGEKTWKALKSTTASMVEGVKGTLGVDDNSSSR